MSWQEKIARILEADTANLVDLAKITGLSPTRFYIGSDLSGVDLRGQDLSTLDFTGAALGGAVMDKGTIIAPEFDPRLQQLPNRRSISLPFNLYICVRVYESSAHYAYTGWAIKRLIEMSFYDVRASGASRWLLCVERSRSLRYMISQSGVRKYDLKMNSAHYNYITDAYSDLGTTTRALRLAIFAGIMAYWNVTPQVVYQASSILDILTKLPLNRPAQHVLDLYKRHWREGGI